MSDQKVDDFKCEKCKRTFKLEKKYQSHVNNKLNPCDYTCVGCYKQVGSRASWDRHKNECKRYKIVAREIEKRESPEYNTFNTVSADGSYNNLTNNNQHNHNNLIMLNPFGQEHAYMYEMRKLDEFIGSARDIVVKLVAEGKYDEAYEKLFQHIHGNLLKPESHNIYMNDIDKDDVYFFNEVRFNSIKDTDIVPKINRTIWIEIRWLIKSANLSEKNRDKLLDDIDEYYNNIEHPHDPKMRRLLFNNRDLVKDTIVHNFVTPNNTLVRFKNNGKPVGVTDRITLPD